MGFDAGDSNLYRYALNRPVAATDASGLYLVTTWGEFEANRWAEKLEIRYKAGNTKVEDLGAGLVYIHTDRRDQDALFDYADASSRWSRVFLRGLAKTTWQALAQERNKFLFASGAVGEHLASTFVMDPFSPQTKVTLSASQLTKLQHIRKRIFAETHFVEPPLIIDIAGEGRHEANKVINVNIGAFRATTPPSSKWGYRNSYFIYGDGNSLTDFAAHSVDGIIQENWKTSAAQMLRVLKPTGTISLWNITHVDLDLRAKDFRDLGASFTTNWMPESMFFSGDSKPHRGIRMILQLKGQ